ncbi:hypothetical protein SCHPADRAFT_911110 [Schizopora paradoxa]|uniref:Uncharacterized protein n=1 Tax=Schizopora paradoxa TaxID=27342 RepID=A0A0H2R783_9AGAM|nr:hypothetical protein SCHPADRAFT_911110 [Schizopora paradoxa]
MYSSLFPPRRSFTGYEEIRIRSKANLIIDRNGRHWICSELLAVGRTFIMTEIIDSKKPHAGRTISIGGFPNEILCHIFEFSLWTIVTKPITTRAAAADHLSGTPPYNIQLTHRAWREIVLTTPSLWTSIFLSVDFPSKEDLLPLERMLERHLQRSGDFPLTCLIEFSEECEMSGEIAKLLAENERRWDFVTSHTARSSDRIPEPLLRVFNGRWYPENLLLHYTKTYQVSESENTLFRSLVHLGVETHPSTDYISVLDLLRLAPNLEYLNIFAIELSDSITMRWGSVPYPHVVSLPFLRDLSAKKATPLTEAVLEHITCPTLVSLSVGFGGVNWDKIFADFLRRSSPPLRVLYLEFGEFRHLMMVQSSDAEVQVGAVESQFSFDAFAFAPSVRYLRLRWWQSMDTVALFRVLSRAKSIFPALEDLELDSVCASPEQYNQLVASRWRVEPRVLKSLTLEDSYYGQGSKSDSLALPHYTLFDKPSILPAAFSDVQAAIAEGLRFTSELEPQFY